jgi:hypothetical protein
MGRVYTCDLHNHTCLSPCAQLDMHPRALVQALLARGVDIGAVTDHNASENIIHVMHAARGTGLTVIPGMEVTTREEAHVLALFEDISTVEHFQKIIYKRLAESEGEATDAASQPIINENEEVEGFNRHQLFSATEMPIDELTDRIHYFGGIAIASHIDRSFFSVISQLGAIPRAAHFDALELSSAMGIAGGRRWYPELAEYTFITSSDAHSLDDVGRSCTRMRLESPTLKEIRLALAGQYGRCVLESAP